MPRKADIHQRPVAPDPIFQSTLVTRFIKGLMRRGKRTVAERVFYRSMLMVEERANHNPLEVFEQAFRNVMPEVEVRSRRVGGSTYQVPNEVRPKRRVALTIRWLVEAAAKRPEHSMEERLAHELMDAARGGRSGETAGRHLSHGGSQPGLCSLPVLSAAPGPKRRGGGKAGSGTAKGCNTAATENRGEPEP